MKEKNSDNKTVLITGGRGYIGSRLTELLVNKTDYNIVVVDNLSFGYEPPHPPVLAKRGDIDLELIKGDITSAAFMEGIFDKYKFYAVVHLAAIVGDPACAKQPELAKAVNWEASLNILEQSIKNGVERFIFASTCSNYGKMSDPAGYVDETSPLVPVSLYAELKTKFENVILNELEKKDSFCPTSLRFATAYGVSPRMRFDLTVNEFIKELALGRELEVFGEQFWRPYCHVHDFARAMLLILNSGREKVAYNVFNVGDTAENYQKQMIVEEIRKFIPGAKVKYVEKKEDPRDYRVSFEKIKDKLGFGISQRLSGGIKEIKHLIDNKIVPDPDDIKYRNS